MDLKHKSYIMKGSPFKDFYLAEIPDDKPITGDLAHIMEGWQERQKTRTRDIRCDMLDVFKDHKLMGRVQKELEKMGYRHMEFLDAGTWAMAMVTGDNHVIRIQAEEPILTNDRIDSPGVLKALETRFVKAEPAPPDAEPARDIRIELLPRLRTKEVTDEHRRKLYKAFEASNLQVNDLATVGNVGLMDVGGKEVPVLIDVGLLRQCDKRLPVTAKPEHWQEWLDTRGKPLQEWVIQEMQAKLDKVQGTSGRFSEVMAKCIDTNWPRRCGTVSIFEEEPRVLAEVEKKLGQMGFRHFDYVGRGVNAVALHTTEDQILRISFDGDDQRKERPLLPGILQPIATHVIKSGQARVRVEVLPRVRTEGVTQEQRGSLADALLASGWHVGDIDKPGNVGLIEVKGKIVPVLVDPGCLVPTDWKKRDNDTHWKPWLDDSGAWLQSCKDSRGAASGLVTDRALARADKALRGPRPWRDRAESLLHSIAVDGRPESQTVEAIRTDGMYPEQVGELYKRAAEKWVDVKDGPSFSEALKNERNLMKDEMRR